MGNFLKLNSMLFKEAKELQQIFPTADFKKIDNYLSGLYDEEINSLLPLLGKPLLDKLNEDYQTIYTTSKGIWIETATTEELSNKLSILRSAQKVCAFAYFANNIALMSVRINIGGGASVAYTEGYDAPDEKQTSRLDKNLWHQSLRAKEQLLYHLEEDAKGEGEYRDLWKESNYFYKHSNLLFTTASELHPHFLDLGSTPLMNFVGSIHVQELCTTYYITGTIGEKLTQALIDRKYQQDTTGSETKDAWKRLDHLVRTALAAYMKFEMGEKKDEHVRNMATTQLSLAEKHIRRNKEVFKDYMDIPPEDDEHKPSPHHNHKHCHPSVISKPGDVVANLLP